MILAVGLVISLFVLARAQSTNGFIDPRVNGGSWYTSNTGSNEGEPINVVVTNQSSPEIINEYSVFVDYMRSINMGPSCFNQEWGSVQTANLGDGNELVNSTTFRYDFGDPSHGTCRQSLLGGNHLRFFQQNGSLADTGAYFLAVSVEMNLTYHHNIVSPDGYGLGRQWLTANATSAVSTSSVTGQKFTTKSISSTQFFPQNSSFNINHGLVFDGVVDLWTVTMMPSDSSPALTSFPTSSIPASPNLSSPSSLFTYSPYLFVLLLFPFMH